MSHTLAKFFEILRNVTAYSRVFTEKLIVAQLVTKLFACHGTQKKKNGWCFRKTMPLTRIQNVVYPKNFTTNILH